MSKILAVAAVVVFVSGCATHRFDVLPTVPSVFNYPSIGKENTVQVGESVVAVYKQEAVTALGIDVDVSRKISQEKELVFKQGSKFGLIGKDDEGQYFATTSIRTRLIKPGPACVLPEDRCAENTAYDREGDTNQSGFRVNAKTGKVDRVFQRESYDRMISAHADQFPFRSIGMETVALHPPEFRRELIYSGISGSTVTLSYREFSRDFARPAFTQDLKYDLSQGTTIGYKGARFEVIKADNVSLRYRVLAHLE